MDLQPDSVKSDRLLAPEPQMKPFAILVFLLAPATEVYAHAEDMPAIIHVVDHSWMGLAFITLLVLLLPLVRWRR